MVKSHHAAIRSLSHSSMTAESSFQLQVLGVTATEKPGFGPASSIAIRTVQPWRLDPSSRVSEDFGAVQFCGRQGFLGGTAQGRLRPPGRKRLARRLSWYWWDVNSTAKKWLWRVGISVSGLAFLSLFAAWFGLVGSEDVILWTDWAVGAVLGGLLIQSISFFGRPRSLQVLIAWLLVALGLLFALFGLFNAITLLSLVLAQLVILLRHQRALYRLVR